ncbi:MAG TPA: phage tail protein [Bacillota bacterium]|nr:phage tail protein [Bacillota bacterium]
MSNLFDESKYLQFLPAIFHSGPAGRAESTPNFLGRFLKAFEKILTGIEDDCHPGEQPLAGIGQILDQIDTLFDPLETRADFLAWLAGWVALTLNEGDDWDEGRQRRFIQEIIPLYPLRGTPEGLKGYLKAYLSADLGTKVSISEFLQPLQVGKTSTVGIDTVVGEGRPYYFQVYVKVGAGDWRVLERKIRAILDLLNQEKPAYTHYLLIIKVPAFQIGVHSTVGVDTLTGGAEIIAQPNGRWVNQR